MSNPDPLHDPENVRPDDEEFEGGRPDNWVDAHPELYPIKDDGNEHNQLELAKEQEDKQMEDHFTKEPDNFGGKHYL